MLETRTMQIALSVDGTPMPLGWMAGGKGQQEAAAFDCPVGRLTVHVTRIDRNEAMEASVSVTRESAHEGQLGKPRPAGLGESVTEEFDLQRDSTLTIGLTLRPQGRLCHPTEVKVDRVRVFVRLQHDEDLGQETKVC